jgi:Transcription termination factor
MSQKNYVAVGRVGLGKKTIAPGQPVDGLSNEQIQILLRNGSIRIAEVAADAEPQGNITGAVTADSDTVELSQMKADELKQIATDMGIEGAQKMNKADLVAAIKAVPVEPAE